MKKSQKILVGLGIASAVGITYLLTALKGLPEAFEIDGEDDET